ncbi:uncharacterized protein [Nicotiana tomentosiformis]|uniref:uncharacterized protein n=1 Tax=Nicotiana tomentosiformis TaxID=4098 RepID=UPI00388C6001
MWLQKWSLDFKPEEDLPIAPVCVLLPGLPFHMHTWHYVKQVVSNVGTPLEMDMATRGITRPSMAKVRVEIDLLKPLLETVYVGSKKEDSPLEGFVQKLEYEGIPKYCKFCKKLGHLMINCRVLERKKANETKEEVVVTNKSITETEVTIEERKEENQSVKGKDSMQGQNSNKQATNKEKHHTLEERITEKVAITTKEDNTIVNNEEEKQRRRRREITRRCL